MTGEIVSGELLALAEEIRQEHQACFTAMRSGAEHALKVGRLLLQARALVKHGFWEEWVETNCGFTSRTARTYIYVASNRQLLKTEEISEMTVSGFLQVAGKAIWEVKVERMTEGTAEMHKWEKEREERWKLENEQHQVKEYLDALKVFVHAVREVVPAAEFGKFSPEGARFTMRRHEQLRQELAHLEDVFRQFLEGGKEPG